MDKLRAEFDAYCCEEADCAATIARVWRESGYVCDPHTAVGFYAAKRYREESGTASPVVVLSTASPYKFPGAVLRALAAELPEDEFDQMDALQRLSGLPVPPNLASLRTACERHLDVIAPEEMTAYVKEKGKAL